MSNINSNLQEYLKKSIFSQQNTSDLYVNIISKNNLNNMDVNVKTYLTNKLVQMMKTVFDKIDLKKVTSGNIQKVINGANDLVIQKMNEIIIKNNIGTTTNSTIAGMMPINRALEINSFKPPILQERPILQEKPKMSDQIYNRNTSYMPDNLQDQSFTRNNVTSFIPIGENSNGTNKKNLEENIKDRFSRMQDERNADIKNQRPSTPDFSLDGSGSKKKQQPQQQQQQPQQQQQQYQQQQYQQQQQQQQQYQQQQYQQQQYKQQQPIDQYFQPITNDNFILSQEHNSMDKFFNPITDDKFIIAPLFSRLSIRGIAQLLRIVMGRTLI
jgi:hypothetical protein